MTELARFNSDANLAALLEISPIGLDDYARVRHVHVTSFRTHAARLFSHEDIEVFVGYIQSPTYTDALRRRDLYGGWIGGELVATAGWMYETGRDQRRTARLDAIYVHPLYLSIGIGSRMVREVEAIAAVSDARELAVRAPVYASGFFERLGYRVTARGTHALRGLFTMPVAYLRKPSLIREMPDEAPPPNPA